MARAPKTIDVTIRPLRETDLAAADRIIRVAFGTFLGVPNPENFMGDSDYAYTRWKANPLVALAAALDGKLIGSNFASNWGSFGFFGPLTVLPEFWNQGVAQNLVAATMEFFERWGTRHRGLFTFAQSPKHMMLYQKFGYWPRDLVAIMFKTVAESPLATMPDVKHFSTLNTQDQSQAVADCRAVTNANFEGLDVGNEIRSVFSHNLGETVILMDKDRAVAFAVCHIGARTEAGSGVCYLKFAAVAPGTHAAENFGHLLNACEALAQQRGATKIEAGVNLARREAFRSLFSRGFRIDMQGVAMETGDAHSGYNRAGVYILDDWR